MKKNIIRTFLAAAIVATTVLTTGISVQAAETTTVQTLNKSVIAQVFDATYYAEHNPDVVAVVGTGADALLNHYMTAGILEGRDASATFNASVYALVNTDLAAVYGDNVEAYVEHYVTCGLKEGRIASVSALSTADANTKKAVAATLSTMNTEFTAAANGLEAEMTAPAIAVKYVFGDAVTLGNTTLKVGETYALGTANPNMSGYGDFIEVRANPATAEGYSLNYYFKNPLLDAVTAYATSLGTNVITKEMHETVVANNPSLAAYDNGGWSGSSSATNIFDTSDEGQSVMEARGW